MSNLRQIKAAMRAKGWTDARLAEEAGIHITLMRRYLAEDVDIGIKNAPKIAKALGISVAAVLYGESAA